MLESRTERSALGAASNVTVVDVGLFFWTPNPNCWITRAKKRMTWAPSPHNKPVSILHELYFRDQTKTWIGLINGLRSISSRILHQRSFYTKTKKVARGSRDRVVFSSPIWPFLAIPILMFEVRFPFFSILFSPFIFSFFSLCGFFSSLK